MFQFLRRACSVSIVYVLAISNAFAISHPQDSLYGQRLGNLLRLRRLECAVAVPPGVLADTDPNAGSDHTSPESDRAGDGDTPATDANRGADADPYTPNDSEDPEHLAVLDRLQDCNGYRSVFRLAAESYFAKFYTSPGRFGKRGRLSDEKLMRVINDNALAVVTIYMEAEGEPFEFKVAVGETFLTRMREGIFTNGTLADTVLRRAQYSAWLASSPARLRCVTIDTDDPVVQECIEAWELAKTGTTNYSNHATHYYSPKAMVPKGRIPDWVPMYDQVAEIHGNLMYRKKPN